MPDEPLGPDEIEVDLSVGGFDWSDFERYVEKHGIPEEDWPAAFAPSGSPKSPAGPVPRFEKIEREPPADGIVIEGDGL